MNRKEMLVKYTVAEDGRCFVSLKNTGVPQIYLLTDGVPVYTKKKGKTVYYLLVDILAWYEGEVAYYGKSNEKGPLSTLVNNVSMIKKICKKENIQIEDNYITRRKNENNN